MQVLRLTRGDSAERSSARKSTPERSEALCGRAGVRVKGCLGQRVGADGQVPGSNQWPLVCKARGHSLPVGAQHEEQEVVAGGGDELAGQQQGEGPAHATNPHRVRPALPKEAGRPSTTPAPPPTMKA